MKKGVLIVLSLLLILPSFSFLSFADVAAIQSPMVEPDVSHIGNVTKFYRCYYNPDYLTAPYQVAVVTLTGGSELTVFEGNWVRSSAEFTASQIVYDLQTGSVLNIPSGQPYYNQYRDYYQYFVWSNQNSGSYYVLPDNMFLIKHSSFVEPFVTWGTQILDFQHYSSFVSEPVFDEFNRYFVLAGQDQSYLFAVRYHLQEFSTILDTIQNNQFYWMQLINYMIPMLKKDDNNFYFSVYCDPQLLSIIDAQSQSTILHYGITIAQYDLSTGQFVSSSNFSDLSVGVNEISLSYDFGSVSDYDSVQAWGVYYNDIGNSIHYNLLSCSWSVDPDFITWRQSVENYLDMIYKILSKEVNVEDVTIDSDMSAIDEGQSAMNDLKVTDSQGNKIDAAQQVEAAFSEAASGMDNMSSGISSVNNIISDLFFQEPMILIVLIVFLALGLIVTILGKNVTN